MQGSALMTSCRVTGQQVTLACFKGLWLCGEQEGLWHQWWPWSTIPGQMFPWKWMPMSKGLLLTLQWPNEAQVEGTHGGTRQAVRHQEPVAGRVATA